MPLPASEIDATSSKFLRDKYAIVGVGETTYTRGSGKTTRALATWAVRNAVQDAGLKLSDIDGMLSYQMNDSTASTFVSGGASALGSLFGSPQPAIQKNSASNNARCRSWMAFIG